ncbi:hypothetical protein KA977_03775 [Candidatus Dependentiae bacterium]|nr:hypothetical protein [Candidatus Dependentiae bacterium]
MKIMGNFTLKKTAVQKKIKGLHDERKRKMKMCDSKEDFEKIVKPYLIEIDNEEKELNFNLKQLTEELQEYQENKIEAKALRDKLKEIMNIIDLLDGKSIQMICKMLIESVTITPGKTINEPLEIEINLWGRLPELLNIPLSDLNDKTRLENYLLPCSVQRNEWGG